MKQKQSTDQTFVRKAAYDRICIRSFVSLISCRVVTSQYRSSMSGAVFTEGPSQVRGHMTSTEAHFDSCLPTMDIKELIETVSALQKEMVEEQNNFDSLSAELSRLSPDNNPTKHSTVSAHMVQSQTRLAMLVGRNMKCFTQQAANENTALQAELRPKNNSQAGQPSSPLSEDPSHHTDNSISKSHSDSSSLNGNVVPSPYSTKAASITGKGHTSNSDTRRGIKVSSPSSQFVKDSKTSAPPWKMVRSNQNPKTVDTDHKVAVSNMSVPAKASFTVRSGAKNGPVKLENAQSRNGAQDVDDDALAECINFSAARTMFETSTLPREGKKKNFEITKRSASNAVTYAKSANRLSVTEKTLVGESDAPSDVKMSKSVSSRELGPSADHHTNFSSATLPAKSSRNAVVVNVTTSNKPPTVKTQSNGPPKTARSISVHSQQADWSTDQSGPRYSSYDAAGSIRKKPMPASNNSTNFTVLRSLSNGSSSPSTQLLTSSAAPLTRIAEVEASASPGRSVQGSAVLKGHKVQVSPKTINTLSLDPPAPFIDTRNGVHESPEPTAPQALASVELKKTTRETLVKQNNNDEVQISSPSPTAVQLTNGHPAPQRMGGASSPAVDKPRVIVAAPSVDKPGSLVTPPIVQINQDGFTTDDLVKQRITLKDWDPTLLLKDLYDVKLLPDTEEHSHYINMEGYMEKLPTNKKKATLLKTWKRRYFKATNGVLYYFESRQHSLEAVLSAVEPYREESGGGEKASASFQLMGGSLEDLEGRTIGIDDGRGRYLVVRCPTDNEYLDWKKALESQMGGNIKATYIKPVLASPPSNRRKAVIIDIGSCSVRAGILGEKPALPSVFFPTIVATDKAGGRKFGFDAYKPTTRNTSNVSYPVRPSIRIDKSIDMEVMADMFKKVFADLGVNPKQYWVMLSSPANLSDKLKEQYMDILVKQFDVPGVNIANQTLLAMYSYNAKSGIMVDIGDRLEIVPVTDGYVVEGGVTKQVYGGHRVGEAFNIALTERKYPFFADIEYQIVRLAMEKMCFVSENYDQAVTAWNQDRSFSQSTLPLHQYDLPQGFVQDITIDLGRFNAPEGLFNTEVWGMDNPTLPKLVQKAVQASPLDTRREMWRSIYLSGGATMCPGFTERLHAELVKLVPPTIVVQVHASPQRYHAAFIGAATLAGLPQFQQSCISADEWRKQGPKVLRKWHMY